MDERWTTGSRYEPNQMARAHRQAAKRNPRKAEQHILAAALLEQSSVPLDEHDRDRLAVQRIRRAFAARLEAFKAKLLGVSNAEPT